MPKIKIGIIGGAGPLASSLLYRLIVEECYRKKKDIPEILLINFPFTRGLNKSESEKNYNILKEELAYCLDILRLNHIELAMIACNTLHLFLEKKMLRSLKFIHLPKTVLEKAIEKGFQKILILGTQTTTSSNLYLHEQLEIFVPDSNSQDRVSKIIDDILEGVVKEDQAKELINISKQLFNKYGFEALILGCTELSLLNDRFSLETRNFEILDPLKILADYEK